jgi:hypothetical protein
VILDPKLHINGTDGGYSVANPIRSATLPRATDFYTVLKLVFDQNLFKHSVEKHNINFLA